MSGTHAVLAPSAAAIWMQCAASVRMQLPYANDPPTPESAEGDAAHWLAARAADIGDTENWLGEKAPNDVEITQDMIDGAELFAQVVGVGANHEQRVTAGSIHPHCFGTPDADSVGPGTLTVFDYKYGHRFVEVFENWQLLAYARGVVETRLSGQCPDRIQFVIVQPRAYHPEGPMRTWTITAAQLYDYTAKMHAGAWAAVDGQGVPRPEALAATGPECRDCKARHECTLFQSVAARLVDEVGRTERFNLPPAQLGAELSYLDEALDRLKARRDGLAIQAESHIRAGRDVQGYGMEPGRSTEKWRDDVSLDEVVTMARALDEQLIVCQDVELITPTQARAALKRRKLDPTLLDEYSVRPSGGLKLAQVSTIKARRAFGAK